MNKSGRDKETIEVKRRRQGTTTGPTAGERAEAPVRRRPTSGGVSSGPTGGGGGFTPTSSGGGNPLGGLLGKGGLGCGGIAIVIILFLVMNFLNPGGSTDTGDLTDQEQAPAVEQENPVTVEEAQPTQKPATKAPAATRQPAASQPDQKWLVLLYQDADDKILEQDIYIDLNEAERIGSSDQVTILAQLDRYQSGFSADGNWTGARRYLVTQDDDLQRVGSQLLDDLGEVNMSDGNSLVDFVTWGIGEYPADKVVLILSDHGMGWPGGWTDPDPGGRDPSRAPIASLLKDALYTYEIDNALGEIRQKTGLEAFEIVGMDACLMGDVEVLAALAPHARYAVVSQEIEPALGWAYSSFLQALTANPGIDGAELGSLIVNSYIQEDQRIVDEAARADLLRQGSPLGGFFGSFGGVSSEQLAEQFFRTATLSAIDLDKTQTLLDSINQLAFALQDEDQSLVASARTYAQSFTSVFGKEVPPSYIDLGSFTQLLLRKSQRSAVKQAGQAVLAAIDQAVVSEVHGSNKSGASGISIYFPNSTLYSSPAAGAQSYTLIADRFAEQSTWDDFLAFHYNDIPFEQSARTGIIPAEGQASRAPGAGTIDVSEITASSGEAAPGQPVDLSVDISGTNIGYIFLMVGIYDSTANSIYLADNDYLESPQTQELNGVYYPVWGESGSFTIQLSWEPTVFAINDGNNSVVALFNPENYGSTAQDAVYSVEGKYTFADSGETRYARLYFRDGALRQVFGFTGETETGAPREIIPQAGDTFTVLEKWLDLDSSGKVSQAVSVEGQTLTFGPNMFTLEEIYAPAGEYLVGFIIADMDGKTTPVYTTIRVR